MLSQWEIIQLYKSKSLDQMSVPELKQLKEGFNDWLFLREYQIDEEKKENLLRVLRKIDGLLSEDSAVRDAAGALL